MEPFVNQLTARPSFYSCRIELTRAVNLLQGIAPTAVATFALFLLTTLSSSADLIAAEPSEHPNIVFILADDLGRQDLSGEGSTYYETPRIDSIAEGGMRFTQGYAACQVCSPSRASIMLGTYPSRHGITDWIGAASGMKWSRNDRVLPAEYEHNLPHQEVTIAEALRDAGYATFFAGKWHLGGEGSFPEDHGFEINLGGHHRGSPPGGFFSPYKNPKMSDGPEGESLPIRLAKETAQFIRNADSKPFFAFLSFYSVHGPIQTTPELWKKYREKAVHAGLAKERFVMDRTLPVRQVQDCPIYAGMMESMDNAVGIVLDTLRDAGLEENTVVVFTSDNGGVSSGDAFSTSNLPFRGGKGRQWEGGIREPFYIKAPGIAKAGSQCDTPVHGVDFFPTLLSLAGVTSNTSVDGVDLVPLLQGKTIADRALFWHYPHYGNQGGEPCSIIRRGHDKLIHYHEDGRDELYNLDTDVREQHDTASQNPEVAKALRHELDAWLEATGAKIPQPDSRFDAEKKLRQQRQIVEKRKPSLEKQHAEFLSESFEPNPTWWGSKVTRD